MSSFNRPETLRTCLAALGAAKPAHANMRVLIANAGTPFPEDFFEFFTEGEVDCFQVGNEYFWAEYMRSAWLKRGSSGKLGEFVLFLNEDTFVDPISLSVMIEKACDVGNVVIVGATRQSQCVNSTISYGGFVRGNLPWVFRRPKMAQEWQEVDTFNGNVVLFSNEILQLVDGPPRGFRHSRADLALGVMLKREGISAILLTRPISFCELNRGQDFYTVIKGMTALDAIKLFDSPKYGPWIVHYRFFRLLVGPVLAAPLVLGTLLKIVLVTLGNSHRD